MGKLSLVGLYLAIYVFIARAERERETLILVLVDIRLGRGRAADDARREGHFDDFEVRCYRTVYSKLLLPLHY